MLKSFFLNQQKIQAIILMVFSLILFCPFQSSAAKTLIWVKLICREIATKTTLIQKHTDSSRHFTPKQQTNTGVWKNLLKTCKATYLHKLFKADNWIIFTVIQVHDSICLEGFFPLALKQNQYKSLKININIILSSAGGFGANSANAATQGFQAGPGKNLFFINLIKISSNPLILGGFSGSAGFSGSQNYQLPGNHNVGISYGQSKLHWFYNDSFHLPIKSLINSILQCQRCTKSSRLKQYQFHINSIMIKWVITSLTQPIDFLRFFLCIFK